MRDRALLTCVMLSLIPSFPRESIGLLKAAKWIPASAGMTRVSSASSAEWRSLLKSWFRYPVTPVHAHLHPPSRRADHPDLSRRDAARVRLDSPHPRRS